MTHGIVVSHGVAQGVPTPVNAALTSLVHGREQGQPSLSPAELRDVDTPADLAELEALLGQSPLP